MKKLYINEKVFEFNNLDDLVSKLKKEHVNTFDTKMIENGVSTYFNKNYNNMPNYVDLFVELKYENKRIVSVKETIFESETVKPSERVKQLNQNNDVNYIPVILKLVKDEKLELEPREQDLIELLSMSYMCPEQDYSKEIEELMTNSKIRNSIPTYISRLKKEEEKRIAKLMELKRKKLQ